MSVFRSLPPFVVGGVLGAFFSWNFAGLERGSVLTIADVTAAMDRVRTTCPEVPKVCDCKCDCSSATQSDSSVVTVPSAFVDSASAPADSGDHVTTLPTLEQIANGFKTGLGGRLHAETHETHWGGDKGCHSSGAHCYTPFYHQKFTALRDKPKLKLLEIGVMAGDSLALWSEYFHRGAVFGVDIATSTFKGNLAELKRLGAFRHSDATVLQANPSQGPGAEEVLKHGPFDIIIDDGSHTTGDIMNTFAQLFVRGVKPAGYYCVEDMTYWHLDKADFSTRKEWIWSLIDASQWRGANMLGRDHQQSFVNSKKMDAGHGIRTPASELEVWIETIEFHRQIMCVRKRRLCSDVRANDWNCVSGSVEKLGSAMPKANLHQTAQP